MEGLGHEFFGSGPIFGDKRSDARLRRTFDLMALCPSGTFPHKLSNRADLVGAYRLVNHKRVNPLAILLAHQQQCVQWLGDYEGVALLLHDTSMLDFSTLTMEGLGQIGDGHGQGLYIHNSLLVSPDGGVIGLMNQLIHRRDHVPANETREQRQNRTSRESLLWKQAVQKQPVMPDRVKVIDISDRGSDITEYIAYEIAAGRHFIVRSQHNRLLADEEPGPGKLHDRLRTVSPLGGKKVRVSTPKGGHRDAIITVAFAPVVVQSPRQKRGEHGNDPMALWAVIVQEDQAPEGVEPIEWMLLTNLPVESFEQALQIVEYYQRRWMIEEYHKALKSGCGVETLQFTTRKALDNAIALLSVLAVHVFRIRELARDPETRDRPVIEYEEELKVELVGRAAKHADWRAMTVYEYYIAVARMGGFMKNPKQHPPGWLVLWRGYIRLESMCAGVRLLGERCVQT